MASSRCMNTSCGAATPHDWTKGWPLGSAGFAHLCLNCGSAYENLVFCDTYHSEETGWRDCSFCGKRIHCGCIASKSMFEYLDYGGIGCTTCVKRSRLDVIRRDEISNGFDAVTVGNVGLLRPASVEDRVVRNGIKEEKLLQLCNIMEANETDHFQQAQRVDRSASPAQNKGENLRSPFGEVGTSFFNMTKLPVKCQPSVGSVAYSQLDTRLKDMQESLSQPSLNITLGVPLGTPNFVVPLSGSAAEEDEKSILPFQQGHRSRPIFPKPLKTGTTVNSETRKGMTPLVRIARPPAEGRGKNQLLPRYWPRITDQELEQISGDLNSTIVPLFEKVLSASDAGRIGRLVLPKACAEAYFPPISQSEGLPVRIQDVKGNEWTFQFRFWPNNNSRMYVLEGVTPCIQSMQLQAGDTVTFSRIDPGGQLVMGFRKATNSSDTQDAKISTLPNGSHSGDASFSGVFQNLPLRAGDISLHKIENFGGRMTSGQQPMSTMDKKGTRNIGSKNKRLLMHSEDALELRLTWEEAQDLLRPPPSANPTIVTIDDHEFEEYDEPPVFGKRTIFTVRPTGEQKQWAQCDDCSKWRKLPVDVLLPPKWTCSDNIWDLSRCTCSAPEEMNTKEQENLLRASKDFKKRKIMKSQKSAQELEPSGLDALASAAVLGDSMADLQESGTTTRHPRHRQGCTCIVCIQPPSGKGKHKSTCTCNVCLTVKRRFKTLMLRKKKRLSEREMETSLKEGNSQFDESGTSGTLRGTSLQTNHSENERSQIRVKDEEAANSSGQIDLNCHPDREDMQLEVAGLSMMSLVEAASQPLDSYSKQIGVSSVTSEQQSSQPSSAESERRLSEEGCHGSAHESTSDRCRGHH
ncbi:B3 domain-containing transcription repressor VAL1 isoform X1 [Cucurbita moschata]|uniref:B3 domain-containing transcription repressor VAL1 isoform X1 n=2 Tax=Cucurbita moschata TaxID=3662 RepID=A0A6J1GA64_CUCMO|nr:B3 domain-containing transcription repressor VAL1 isoform X1 [Cucurbita moschata]